MDAKLYLLMLLFGSIIGLSHLNDEVLAKLKQQFARVPWREIVSIRRKS